MAQWPEEGSRGSSLCSHPKLPQPLQCPLHPAEGWSPGTGLLCTMAMVGQSQPTSPALGSTQQAESLQKSPKQSPGLGFNQQHANLAAPLS